MGDVSHVTSLWGEGVKEVGREVAWILNMKIGTISGLGKGLSES